MLTKTFVLNQSLNMIGSGTMERVNPQEKTEPVPEIIGPYKIQSRLARGGMGEVFLGKDPSVDRTLAIKRVRSDLIQHKVVRRRFLKEAKITASLFHPSIIPVYSIHQSENDLYYVMPYVEGATLKDILRDTIRREKSGSPPHPIGISITHLLRIFTSVCQAVSYCHSMGILHRDLKPENIMVGNFGQVLILDWGLAGYIDENEESMPEVKVVTEERRSTHNLTRPGKVIGTLSYMPPERVDGEPAGVHSDIYALGVILYQLLTLRMPFQRTTIEEYKKIRKHETLTDALEAAPYRDIPPQLSEITKKCLATTIEQRYGSVAELLRDLDRYNSGLPDWILQGELNVDRQSDWELQENVLMSKLIPITRSTEIMQWFILMISKQSFSGNKKITAKLTVNPNSEGIGFLLNIPEPKEREGLEDGYCLWIGTKKSPGIKLHRSHVTLVELEGKSIPSDEETFIEIEKMDQTVRLFINHELVLSYTDPLPIVGTHVGLLCQDMEFSLTSFKVYVGSHNAMVGCLSVPDAFLASKNFKEAALEYERIAESFAGRIQGREALFRLGITLIEEAKVNPSEEARDELYERALATFQRLHNTRGEPLEYLGKSLVYRRRGDLEEELKCLELAIRKFNKDPLAHLIEERVLFRLHESAKNDRIGVYSFALITLRHLSHQLANRETHALIHNLSTYSEKLYFFSDVENFNSLAERYRFMAIQVAFWLDKPVVLRDLHSEETSPLLKENIEYALRLLGYLEPKHHDVDKLIELLPPKPNPRMVRPIFFEIESALTRKSADKALLALKKLSAFELSPKVEEQALVLRIWALLLLKQSEKARDLLLTKERLSTQRCHSPFFFLYGCMLAQTIGLAPALEHFDRSIEFAFPPVFSLLSHYLKKEKEGKGWVDGLFSYEKTQLYRQLVLFYHSSSKRSKTIFYERKLNKTAGYTRIFS